METLVLVDAEVSTWNICVRKVLSKLQSILNLVGQLETLKLGKVGVLSQRRSHVTSLLEAKLVQKMEDALGHITEEK